MIRKLPKTNDLGQTDIVYFFICKYCMGYETPTRLPDRLTRHEREILKMASIWCDDPLLPEYLKAEFDGLDHRNLGDYKERMKVVRNAHNQLRKDRGFCRSDRCDNT